MHEGGGRRERAEPAQGPRPLRRAHLSAPELRRNESRLSHRYSGAQTSASTSSTLLSAAPSPNEKTWNERLYDQVVISCVAFAGPASGQTDHEVEHLHREHEPEEQRDLDHRQDDRDDHEAKPLPGAGPVDDRRLPDLHRHVLQRAVEQQGEERDPEPDVGDEDRPERQVRIVQPLDRLVGQARRLLSTWLTAPPSAWNRNRKMTPVTIRGRSQGTMISERASVLPGNRRLNSKREREADHELEDERADRELRTCARSPPGSSGRSG